MLGHTGVKSKYLMHAIFWIYIIGCLRRWMINKFSLESLGEIDKSSFSWFLKVHTKEKVLGSGELRLLEKVPWWKWFFDYTNICKWFLR